MTPDRCPLCPLSSPLCTTRSVQNRSESKVHEKSVRTKKVISRDQILSIVAQEALINQQSTERIIRD